MYPTPLANLVVDVEIGHGHQILLNIPYVWRIGTTDICMKYKNW